MGVTASPRQGPPERTLSGGVPPTCAPEHTSASVALPDEDLADDPKLGDASPRPSRHRKACTSAMCLMLATLGILAWVIYEDAAAARPWYNVHQIGFYFHDEGPSAFRATFAGDTVGSVNPRYFAVHLDTCMVDLRLEVAQPDGTIEHTGLAQLAAVPSKTQGGLTPSGDERLLRLGDVAPETTQRFDVRVEDINRAALVSLTDLGAHKHMTLTAKFTYSTAIPLIMGISTPVFSSQHEARVSVATIFGTDTSGSLGMGCCRCCRCHTPAAGACHHTAYSPH